MIPCTMAVKGLRWLVGGWRGGRAHSIGQRNQPFRTLDHI